jgi:hypothetical protein
MNKSNWLILLGLLAMIFVSCDEPPELPTSPSITFNSVRYGQGINLRDTIILMLDFEDGDGDLGIARDDDDPKFQEFYFVTTNGELINDFDPGRVIFFGEPNQPPYSTKDWFIGQFREEPPIDTVRVEFNPNHHNIFIEFFYRTDMNGDGDSTDDEDYMRIDLVELFGFNFYGRFFPLNTSDVDRPLRGTLTYNMESTFTLNPIFRDQTLKIEAQIQDRALNKSNVVVSNDFRLE